MDWFQCYHSAGVKIGSNVVIGAGCLIYKSIPSNSVVKNRQNQMIEPLY
ncbi:MAG: hypothetical protein HC905_31020 [Bacteroidales bacterium]|nr:hypothetical protein [Bacteroidales bacterium]